MMKKTLFSCAFALLTLCSFAQKPVMTAVTDIEDDPSNGLEMCRSLFDEYFLAELTTHTKVTSIDTASIQKVLAKLKIGRGEKLTAKQVKDVCRETKTDAICFVKIKKQNNVNEVTIRVVSSQNVQLGVCKGTMNTIGDAGDVSAKLAGEAAVLLRKLLPEDQKVTSAPIASKEAKEAALKKANITVPAKNDGKKEDKKADKKEDKKADKSEKK